MTEEGVGHRQGWCQGDLIPPADSRKLLNACVDLAPAEAEGVWTIVVSQDCDIYRSDDDEPFVELAVAHPEAKVNPAIANIKSYRAISLPIDCMEFAAIEVFMREKFRVPKQIFSEATRQVGVRLGDGDKDNFRIWLAQRYGRVPFANEFERRMNLRHRSVKKIIGKDAWAQVSAVWISASREELKPGEDYVICGIVEVPTNIDPDILNDLELNLVPSLAKTLDERPGIRVKNRDDFIPGDDEDLEDPEKYDFEVSLWQDVTRQTLAGMQRVEFDYQSSDEGDLHPGFE